MTEQNQRELGSILWGIADQLCGAMNPDNYPQLQADDCRIHLSYPTPITLDGV